MFNTKSLKPQCTGVCISCLNPTTLYSDQWKEIFWPTFLSLIIFFTAFATKTLDKLFRTGNLNYHLGVSFRGKDHQQHQHDEQLEKNVLTLYVPRENCAPNISWCELQLILQCCNPSLQTPALWRDQGIHKANCSTVKGACTIEADGAPILP